MEMNTFNGFFLCYKYTTSKLFYDVFMMNVIMTEYCYPQKTQNCAYQRNHFIPNFDSNLRPNQNLVLYIKV